MLNAQGNTVLASTAIGQDYGYTAQRYDRETQLWYFKHRYLDDGLGRFISRDPAGYVDGMNLYTAYFVLTGTDPLGLQGDFFSNFAYEFEQMWSPAAKKASKKTAATLNAAATHAVTRTANTVHTIAEGIDAVADTVSTAHEVHVQNQIQEAELWTDSVNSATRQLYTGDSDAPDTVFDASKTSAGRWLERNSPVVGGFASGNFQLYEGADGNTVDLMFGGAYTLENGGQGFIGLGGGQAMNDAENPGFEIGSAWSGFGPESLGETAFGVGFGGGGTGISAELTYTPDTGLDVGAATISIGTPPIGDRGGASAGLILDPSKLGNLFDTSIPEPEEEYVPEE